MSTITPEVRREWRHFAKSAVGSSLFPQELWTESEKVLRLLEVLEGAEQQADGYRKGVKMYREELRDVSARLEQAGAQRDVLAKLCEENLDSPAVFFCVEGEESLRLHGKDGESITWLEYAVQEAAKQKECEE
jgi:hypothetical protein